MKFTTLAIAGVLAVNVSAMDADLEIETVPVEGTYGQRQLEKFRGGWLGFNKGLYKKSSSAALSKTCLDEDVAQTYDEMIALWDKINMTDEEKETTTEELPKGDLFTMVGKFFQIGANVSECGFRKPMRDISHFCHPEQIEAAMELRKYDDLDLVDETENSAQKCSFPDFLQNISKNAFVLMGKSSEMAETWKEYPAPELDELHDQALILGESFGTFVRTGLQFEQ